jgi:type IV pilus assembly protein PilE
MTMKPRNSVPTGKMAIAPSLSKAHQAGFTLLELMVVVGIVAILAAIALPAYTGSVAKTNRKAAEGCLAEYANYMERYYTTNMRYDQDTSATPVANTLPALDCASTQQTGSSYTYTVPTLTASTYTVQAAPQGVQATRDKTCATLTLNQVGTRTVSGSGTLAQCW